MSRWMVGLVVLICACASSRPAPTAPSSVPTPTATTPAAPPVKAAEPADELGVAAAAYKRGEEANVAWKFADATRDLEIALQIYDAKLPDTDERFLNTLEELGRATRGAGDWERSEAMVRRWRAIVQVSGDRYQEARALNNLGLTLDQSGDPRSGKRMFEAAIAIDDELGLADDDEEKNAHMHTLALVLSDLDEHKRAAKLLERVLAVDKKVDPVSVSTANTMHNLALNYRDDHQYEKAKPLFESAIRILTAKVGPTHPRIVPSLNGLAGTLLLLREYDEAELMYQQVLAIPDLNIHSRSIALADLAVVYTETSRPEEAIKPLGESLALLEKHYANVEGHAEMIRTLIKRAEAYVAIADYKGAIRDTDAGIAMSAKINAALRELVATTVDRFARIWESVPSEPQRETALKPRAPAVRAGK